jgi:hypothetical protein
LKVDFETLSAKSLCEYLFNSDTEVQRISESDGKTPDFFIPNVGAVLEIKRIIDQQDLQQGINYGRSADRLVEELKKHDWTGEFSIDSAFFHISKQVGKELMEKTVCALLERMRDIKVGDKTNFLYIEGDIHFKIFKVNDIGKEVYLSASAFSYGYDQSQCNAVTQRNIIKANQQVSDYRRLHPGINESWLLLLIEQFHLQQNHTLIQTTLDQTRHEFGRVFGANSHWNKEDNWQFVEFDVKKP